MSFAFHSYIRLLKRNSVDFVNIDSIQDIYSDLEGFLVDNITEGIGKISLYKLQVVQDTQLANI